MKKILLVLAITIATISINAQNLGIKGGYNYANFTGEKADKLDLKSYDGFYVGAFLELPLSRSFSIQPEVIYSRQGSNFKIADITSSLAMDYITVPVLVKINLTRMLSIQGGPQFGFLTNSPEFELAKNMTSGEEKLSKDAFGKFDFGMGVGISVHLLSNILVEARYTHGFTNIFNKDNNDFKNLNIGENTDFNNSVFSIGLGLTL